MYIPSINRMTDRSRIVAFMRRFSFATLIASSGDRPIATHLPFIVQEEGETLFLVTHMALQNEQWKQMEAGREALVIFQEPHAYISPTHYEKELNVPTWNYLAVHAYGRAALMHDPARIVQVLEAMIDTYEESYREQWSRLPDKYKQGLMTDVVALRIEVTELQAKEKLSQNKTASEQQRIIDALSRSEDSAERGVAEYMRGRLEGNQ